MVGRLSPRATRRDFECVCGLVYFTLSLHRLSESGHFLRTRIINPVLRSQTTFSVSYSNYSLDLSSAQICFQFSLHIVSPLRQHLYRPILAGLLLRLNS